ncbi:MAG: amidohydrolase family protein [Pseudomonadota bacterium]
MTQMRWLDWNASLIKAATTMAALAIAISACAPSPDQEAGADASAGAESDDGGRILNFTTNEGTWMSLDVSPDGETIVFDMLGDLYLLPVSGGMAEPILQGAAWDIEPRFSPDGAKIAFISDRVGANNVWTYDVATGVVKQVTFEVQEGLASPEWSADGRSIYARQKLNIQSINYKGPWLLRQYDVEGGASTPVLGADEFKHPSGKVTQVAGLTPTGPSVSPDGAYLYYAGQLGEYKQRGRSFFAFQIARLDLESGETATLTEGYDGAFRPEVSPNNDYLAFARRDGGDTNLLVRDLATGEDRLLLKNITRDESANRFMNDLIPAYAWTPDGESIVIAKDGGIVRVNILSGDVQNIPFSADVSLDLAPTIAPQFRITDADVEPRVIRWLAPRPDGAAVAFQAVGKIWSLDRTSGEVEKLLPGDFFASAYDEDDAFEFSPAWSPRGDKLAYAVWNKRDGGAINIFDVATQQTRAVTDAPGQYANPNWSPDGKTLIYTANRTQFPEAGKLNPLSASSKGAFTINAVDLESGETSRLFVERRALAFPRARFTPDGAAIAFLAESGEAFARFVSVDVASGEETTLARKKWAMNADLSPSGDFIAFEAHQSVHIVSKLQEQSADENACGALGVFPGDSPVWLDDRTLAWVYDRTYTVASVISDLDTACPSIEVVERQPMSFSVPRRASRGALLLTNARLITVAGAARPVIENGAVLIEDGRIAAVGAAEDIETPEGVDVIDLEGATIMPGMIDMHAHPFSSYLSEINPQQHLPFIASLAYGVTTMRDPAGDSNVSFSTAELVETGQILGSRYFGAGNPIIGFDKLNSERIKTKEDAFTVVAKRKAKGAITLKEYGLPTRYQRQWLTEAARAADVGIINENTGDYHLVMSTAVDGYSGIEHSLTQAPLYKDALQLLAATNIAYDPVLVFPRAGAGGRRYFPNQLDLLSDEKYLGLSDIAVVFFMARQLQSFQVPAHDFVFLKQGAAANDLKQAGGRVVTGSHADGIVLHFDVWAYVESGMTPLDAIETATLSPARAIGVDRDLGSIEVGKIADFIIMRENPLENIRHTLSIEKVVKGGVVYDGDTLDEVWPIARTRPPFFWSRYIEQKKAIAARYLGN